MRVHPDPQLQLYNQVLQYISLPISFSFAVQNLWITALMISFETPNIVDSFIWILPNIVAILIRPSLINYVHKVYSPRQAELALVTHFIFAGAIGSALIAICSQYFQDYARICICAIGWTVMDTSFEMADFFSQKAKQRLNKHGYKQIQEDKNYSSLAGNILGYSISFLICWWKGGKSMKKFYLCSSYIYWIASICSIAYWLTLYISSRDRLNLQSQIHPNQSVIPNRSVAEYLPGYYELKMATGFDRWVIALHFTFSFIVDTLLIYGAMWIILAYETVGEKQGLAYNLGMKQGSLLLLTFTVFSYINVLKFLFSSFNLMQSLRYFKILLIIICATSLILFAKTGHQFIFALAALIGMADGLYNKLIYPKLIQNYPVFQACEELIGRIQKIVILCPMPFVVMMILQRDDIIDCLVCVPLIVISLLISSRYWKDKDELDATDKVRKIDKQL